MPSTRASNFSGGGLFKRKDGTIVGIEFTPTHPSPKMAPKADARFIPLWAVLSLLLDGQTEPGTKALRVGSVEDFEVVLDGKGVSGTAQFRKSEEFAIFMESLSNPKDGGDGQPEDTYPEDPEGLIADYTNLVGTRVMFDEVNDESDYAKKNPRKAKNKDGTPKLGKDGKQITYPQTHLVVAQYYGQVDVAKLAKPATGKTPAAQAKASTGGRPTAAKVMAPAASLDAVTVQARAEAEILKAVTSTKGKPLSKTKLMVKLLTQLGGEPQALNDAVRLWADNDTNLSDVDGVSYDAGKKELTVAAE